jgi:hypothetical protein
MVVVVVAGSGSRSMHSGRSGGQKVVCRRQKQQIQRETYRAKRVFRCHRVR